MALTSRATAVTVLWLLVSMIFAPMAQARYLTHGRAHAEARSALFRLAGTVEAGTLGSATVTVVDREHVSRCRRVSARALDCPAQFRRTRSYFEPDRDTTAATCRTTLRVQLVGTQQRVARAVRKGSLRCATEQEDGGVDEDEATPAT